MPPPVLGSTPLRPLAISLATPPLLDPPLPELSPLELPLLPELPEPEPPEPPLSSEPPELSPHCSGVGLIIGQASTGKETLASNVLSPSSFTVPKSFITSESCTIWTGSDTGSVPSSTGLGPGPNLSTVVLPV